MEPVSSSPFLLGVNYWPKSKAMYWWKSFDASEVEQEFAQIAEWGLSLVRFCLVWEDFQPQPDQVDETQLHHLAQVMDIAEQHGLRAVPALLVGNMSGVLWFPSWAFSDEPQDTKDLQIAGGHYMHRKVRSPFQDPLMLRAEVLLARRAAEAVAGHPALHSWDLANEIDQGLVPSSSDAGWLWAWCVSRAIREGDPTAAVTYGAHPLSLTTRGLTIPAVAPSLDYLSMHGYPIYSDISQGPLDPEFAPFVTTLTAQLGAKPALMQEFGVCTAEPGQPSHTVEDDFLGEARQQFLASEEDAATYYGQVLDRLWQTGALGAVAWDYADYPSGLWNRPPLDKARRERTFGIFRADGSPKPAAKVIRHFAEELHSGQLTHRLGIWGSDPVNLNVDPDAYYHDPKNSYRQMYQRYLEQVQGSGDNH